MINKIVVVGAGQAGVQAAQTLRQKGYEGELVMLGNEPQPPYQRPPLSKKFLSGEVEPDALFIRPEAFYEMNNIDLKLNAQVDRIDLENKSVTLASGEAVSWDKLLLATGTRARDLPLPGADLEGVVTLRSIGDVELIKKLFAPGKKLVVIGGGYIGLEVTAVAKGMGLDVVVLEAQERLLKRVVSPDVSSFFHNLHAGRGAELHCGTGVTSIEGEDGKVTGVKLADGTELPCDLVLSAVGAVPNSELAAAAGLDVDDGILVDGAGQTSHEDVYACGDCVRFFSERYGRSIRLESVQNAIDQAKAVAVALTDPANDHSHDYDPLPWFWSDQHNIKLQIAGLSNGYDEAVLVGDTSADSFYVAYLEKGKLIAVDSINHPRSHMMARRVIGQEWKEGLLPPA
ncbi:3-phenylpropionate/trans-cinnamate dioxygenase ferredoxin reductase subunit [Pseudovibrio denitrificans]|uniref:3-phenylpropionate/trans-cinnamate dioxygenase ferredoxin reductase subunit n=1 Tax=Pseudovibrio denitrificans TaxID=258256 RepID=A0A1I7AG12_9HYPH|nr:FAD/NAD(P)-binding oxidoreductase [Pseudovibrio denitrificans]SFT73892.1 3-phenylpropionate/trans-cinnamate dioxygenase ferredoxin reductase subunit [Pseudovibrio denitrificans]